MVRGIYLTKRSRPLGQQGELVAETQQHSARTNRFSLFLQFQQLDSK